MLVPVKEKFEEVAAEIQDMQQQVETIERGSLKAIAGRAGFPSASVGKQTLAITFPNALPTTPIYVGLVWDEIGDAIVCRDTYVGELGLVRNSITTTGFTAMTYRANASYSWSFRWIAFYYDE